ncbi:MAG: endonuclease/exonuclease/phosphatase family protein, partial [Chitinophagaceae bacterium]|nr:endonuclease/exonuclease/phosphatase family protein [Chitinophagaceae bacterium]
KNYDSNIKLFDSIGYKYYYLPKDDFQVNGDMTSTFGSIIISKTPITDTHRVNFPSAPHESIVFGDVIFNSRKVRLATMHLVSLDLGAPDDRSEFYGRVDQNFLLRKSRMQKLKFYDSIHASQAEFVRQLLDKSPYPVIISGDFNSVPGSYTYHKIKGNLQDCFVEKGYGFGRTFSGLSPTLRIDYIMADKQFKVRQYTAPAMYLSDHFPVVTDVTWK